MTESKRALVTGLTGQDGSYLAELLLAKGYEVHGLIRRLSKPNLDNIRAILDDVRLIDGDLMDQQSLNTAVRQSKPDEVYHLASQSFVGVSFTQPALTGEITGLGTLRVLEAVRSEAKSARVYNAASSEMFGKVTVEPQDEDTRFHPRSPYGVAKVYGYMSCVNYREAYDMYVSNGILFNHESPRRGIEFVTRKVARAAALAKQGSKDVLSLGNLDARRDWGYAPEYVDMMWRTLQQDDPDDYVGATGESHTVQELVREAFSAAGLDTWRIAVDPKFARPAEVYNLRGDASKAKTVLGWEPTVRFKELVRIMVDAELSHREGYK